ncbi:muscarinic acetylcholine receptor M3-like [Salvelinus fontinalis]|uniref:muscarinic acetylcholine receptor M3-like n=1 Tax=Salvelinus fontinalis TaxID=8038 RepID=UPI0024869D36|nr:muscarinic acetylcholine receptor M3-like [Salvelinus fontinalis]
MNHSCVSQTSDTTNVTADPLGGHEIWEVVVIVLITGPLSLVTIIGNLLVVISFRVNRQLRTFSNYFLLSLAVADLILGAVSMNLYAVYIIMGRWTLGSLACDVWLAVDYVASNASVMNLLVISFDRFYSITRPLTYRAKRTTRRAAAAIGLAWAVSFILWGPAILFWPHVVGRASQGAGECSIPFLTEPALTFGTAIAAFYLPVTIMGILYWKIYWEIEKRAQGLEGLMGSGSSGGASQVSGRRDVYSSSTKSSVSSSREVPVGREQSSEVSQGCFPVREEPKQSSGRRIATLSLSPTKGAYREGCRDSTCNVDEEEPTVSLSSSEEEPEQTQQGVSAKTSPKAIIPLRDAQGRVTVGATKPLTSRAEDSTTGPQGRQPPLRGSTSDSRRHKQPKAKRRRNTIVREKKAARTLCAILLAFILTWTPYNIMVLVSVSYCVPEKLWQLGYWLCYINSTVNPVCYALCNEHFRVTFKTLLLCRPGQRNWGMAYNANHASFRTHKTSSTV